MRTWPLIALSILAPSLGQADTVHLTNGRTFEGVMAEVSGSKVLIRMQGGSLSLPLTQVAKIDRGDSTLQQYLGRKEALTRAETPSAVGWLDLAVWAQGKGLATASREAALTAAQIDPRLPGLENALRPHAYVFESALGRWIPYSDSMRRKGMVLSRGEWVGRAEFEAEERAREAALERQREQQVEARRAARADRLEELATLALVREARRAEAPPAYTPYYPGIVVMPGYYPIPVIPPVATAPAPPVAEPQPREKPRPQNNTFTRVPGSLIPGNYPGTRDGHGNH